MWASLLSSAGALVELKAPCLTDIVLVHVVDYIYTGALPNGSDQQECSALLAAASYLQMDGLLEALQTKFKSVDNTSSSTAMHENQSCKLDNSTEANVEDMCQQLSSTCIVKSSEKENQHRGDVSVCSGCERRSCCENADLNVFSIVTGECRPVHSQAPCDLIQSISSTVAWHRASGEDNEMWEDQFHTAGSWQVSGDELPRKAENGKSLNVLLGEEARETSEEDRKMPQGARETRESKDVKRKRKNKDKDHQRGQHLLSTSQPGKDFSLTSTLFDDRSSSTISHPCSGAVPVIRHSSTASKNLSTSPSLQHPVTRSTVGCRQALPSGSTDNDQNAEGTKNEFSNQPKAEKQDANKQGEMCCDSEASTQTAQEDALCKPNRQDCSGCSRGNDRYWDRLGITDDHINHRDSFQSDSQHFRTDLMAPNKDKDKQLQCSNCHVLTATATENQSAHSPGAQSVVHSPLQESGTGSFSHYEKFGLEREMTERLNDSHKSPADSNEQHSQYHRFGDWNESVELNRGEKSFPSTVCVQLADTDTDATADAGIFKESLVHENISEQSSTFDMPVDKKSDVDSGFVAPSYHGHIHYHCLSQEDPRFDPQHSFHPHAKPSSQSGDEQEAGFIPCQAPGSLSQPLAYAEQVVLLDISTKSPERLVSCTSDKTAPWLAFAQKDTSRNGLENIAGQGAEGQNTAAGSSVNSENPPPALTICSSSGVPDYVETSSTSTLSVCMPSAVPVTVPTNVSEQLSAPLHHPFQCSMCERSFSQRGSLNRHVRSHLGIRPFPCPRCPMTFSRQYRVTEHMRVHQRFVPECDFPKPSAPPI